MVTVEVFGKRVVMSEAQAKVFVKTYDGNLEALREVGTATDPKQAARIDSRRKAEAAGWAVRRAAGL